MAIYLQILPIEATVRKLGQIPLTNSPQIETMQDASIILCLSDACHPIKWFSVHTACWGEVCCFLNIQIYDLTWQMIKLLEKKGT